MIPERFGAKVEVQPDASYTFTFDGTAVYALAAAQLKKAGSLTEKEQTELKAEADKLAKKPGFKHVAYKGNARYEMLIEEQRKSGTELQALNIFRVWTDKEGVMTIAVNELKPKDKAELEQLGISIDGTLDVRLPKNAEVISHNATSAPSFMGLFGTYSWKIGRIDQRPMMKIRFKPN